MQNFLISSACNGRQPVIQGVKRHIVRSHIMKKLLSNRDVARFLVAPSGFGKTCIAYEYAKEMYNFYDTYWLDASHPFFLRDLDSGEIESYFKTVGKDISLLVIDSVPFLETHRAEILSRVIDNAIKRGWEVLLTITPTFDTFSSLQADRICVSASDLLLTDAEMLSTIKTNGSFVGGHKGFDLKRIPSVGWGAQNAATNFIWGLQIEEMPDDLQLALFVMLTLQHGTSEDVALIMRSIKKDTLRFMQNHFPFLAIDTISESFDTCVIDIEGLIENFKDSMDRFATISAFSSSNQLVIKMADILIQNGNYTRASELIVYACGRHKRLSWIETNQDLFHSAGCLSQMEFVASSLGDHPAHVSPRFLLGTMMRRELLGDTRSASLLGYRVLHHAAAEPMQIYIASILALCLPDPQMKGLGIRKIVELEGKRMDKTLPAKPQPEQALMMSLIGMLSQEDYDGFILRMHNNMGKIVMSEIGFIIMMIALYLKKSACMLDLAYEMLCCRAQSSMRCVLFEALLRVQFLRELEVQSCEIVHLSQNQTFGRSDMYDTVAFDVSAYEYPSARDEEVRTLYADYVCQCELYSNSCRNLQLPFALVNMPSSHLSQGTALCTSSRDLLYKTDISKTSAPAYTEEIVPQLCIRLFGGMEVTIGGEVISPKLFTKQKSKTLLAILAINLGHEVPRQMLLDTLWPNLIGDAPVNNFYSMWSILRKALRNENGECPYLVRQQASCMLDARYVTCDVASFENLCRSMMFDGVASDTWPAMYLDLESIYAGELLPSEVRNEYIVRKRDSYRQRMVDALVSAAHQMCERKEYRNALWFARAAMSKDSKREDVYRALLEAQALAGQKTEAIETYVKCCNYMSEEYGVNPSQETIQLYESLVLNIDSSGTQTTR